MARKWFGKQKRFLNPYDKECMAALSWSVCVYTNDDKNKAEIEANWAVNREAQNHYVCRRGDLRPIQTARREMIKFEEAYDKAEQWIKDKGYKAFKI